MAQKLMERNQELLRLLERQELNNSSIPIMEIQAREPGLVAVVKGR